MTKTEYFEDEKIFSKEDLIRFAKNVTTLGLVELESKFRWWFDSQGTPYQKVSEFKKRKIKEVRL